MKPSFSSEETTNHSTAEIAGEPAGRKGAGRDIGGLAELVAARKGEGIRDGKDDGDDCNSKISFHTPMKNTIAKSSSTYQPN